MPTEKIKIGIVDDHLLFRQGLSELLKKKLSFEVIFETDNLNHPSEFLNKIDILLLDIKMPEINGLKLLTEIRKKNSKLRIVMLSQYDDNQTILYAIKNGANGFLSKSSHFTEIINCIEIAHTDGYYITPNISKLMAQNLSNKTILPIHLSPLSNREKEIIKLVCEQKTSKEISDELYISTRTVESHLENLYKKTGVKKKEGLVIYAIKNNIFKID